MADVWVLLGVQNGEVMTCDVASNFGGAMHDLQTNQAEIIMNNLDEDEEPDLDAAGEDLVKAANKATKNGTLPYAQFEDEVLGDWVWELYRRPLNRRG